MTIKYFIFFIGCIFMSQQSLYAQLKIHQFSQLDSLQKIENRNVIIFIHTDWCNYCQMMKNTTYKDERVIQELNDKYYFVDLNAEEKSVIRFGGRLYKFKPSGANTGIHELAEQLATINHRVTYPTICILNPNNEIIFQCNQFINSIDFILILSYFIEPISNNYLKAPQTHQ